MQRLLADADSPDTDDIVRVSTEKRGAVRGPAQGDAVRLNGALAQSRSELRLEVANFHLALEIPDLDAVSRRRAQPVAIRGEAQGVDDVTRWQSVQTLALAQVPEHGCAVLPARGAEGTVRGDGDPVQVAGVASEVCAQLAVGEIPDLDKVVPAARDDHGVGWRRREAHARHPLGVSIFLDGVLAFPEGVPKLNSLVAGSRHNLAVISRESD